MKNIFVLILTFASALIHAQNAHQRMDFAAEKLKQKDTLAALAFLEQAQRLEPRNPLVYATRAELYVEMGNFKEAKSDYDKAVLIAKKDPKYLNLRASFFNKLGYYQYTIKDAGNALALAENNPEEKSYAYYLRGEGKFNSGSLESALADYDSALAITSESSVEIGSLLSSARVLGQLKRHKEAIARLEKIIAKYQDFTIAYNNLGYQYIQDGQYKKAIETYDKVIADIEKRGNGDYMLQSGSEVIDNGKEKSAPLNNRGFAKYKLGNNKAALKDINASLEIDADNSYAYKNRALLYIATKKQKEACADLQKALDLGYTETYDNEAQKLLDEHCKE